MVCGGSWDMPGTPMGRPGLNSDFGLFLGLFLETLGKPWETRGGTRKPQDGLQMAPQRLIEDPLVVKRWPGQPGQDFGRKNAYFQGAWQDQNVVKP